MNEQAEIISKKYLYRKLIIQGKIKLSLKNAIKLAGPDCAYRLYSVKKNIKK